MPTLRVPGATIHYEQAGAGEPLVFLHGVGSSSHTWAGQLAHFAGRYLAVAPDMRGYARSTTDPATVSMARFAADVAELIDHLDAGPAHVCGLSMGGIVALTLWRDHPARVRSLALADPWANHPAAAANQRERLSAIDAASMRDLAGARMPAIYGPNASPALIEAGVSAFARLDKAPYRAASADLWTQDLRQVARTVTVPALVLVGEQDPLTPLPLSEELASLIPNARLVMLERAGHLSNEENPPAFNEALDSFLNSSR